MNYSILQFENILFKAGFILTTHLSFGGQCYNNDNKNTICTHTFIHYNSYKYIYVFLLPLLNVHIPEYDRHVILHWGVITVSHSLECARHTTFQNVMPHRCVIAMSHSLESGRLPIFQNMIAMSYPVKARLPCHTPQECL